MSRKFLRIKSGCVAFGRTCPAGQLIDLELLTEPRALSDMDVLIGSGLAEIVERWEVIPEPPRVLPEKKSVSGKAKKK